MTAATITRIRSRPCEVRLSDAQPVADLARMLLSGELPLPCVLTWRGRRVTIETPHDAAMVGQGLALGV